MHKRLNILTVSAVLLVLFSPMIPALATFLIAGVGALAGLIVLARRRS